MLLKCQNPVPHSNWKLKLNKVFPAQEEKVIDANFLRKKLGPVLFMNTDFHKDVLKHQSLSVLIGRLLSLLGGLWLETEVLVSFLEISGV